MDLEASTNVPALPEELESQLESGPMPELELSKEGIASYNGMPGTYEVQGDQVVVLLMYPLYNLPPPKSMSDPVQPLVFWIVSHDVLEWRVPSGVDPEKVMILVFRRQN